MSQAESRCGEQLVVVDKVARHRRVAGVSGGALKNRPPGPPWLRTLRNVTCSPVSSWPCSVIGRNAQSNPLLCRKIQRHQGRSPLLLALRSGRQPLLSQQTFTSLAPMERQQLWQIDRLVDDLEPRATTGPVLVCIDDFQWADSATALAMRVLQDGTNTRTDEYGGDLVGRARFPLQAAQAAQAAQAVIDVFGAAPSGFASPPAGPGDR